MSQAFRLTCTAVLDETPTVRTFTFRPDVPVAHEAGQALTLCLEVDGETLYRTFSLSAPTAPDGLLALTVKAHRDGRATRWLHDRLAPGSTLTATGPHGRFTLAKRGGSHPVAFVSAGSGATPLMAMLRHLAAGDPTVDAVWYHAARGPSEALFPEVLTRLQERMPNLRVAVAVGRAAPGWFGLVGRTSRRLLSVAIPDLPRRSVFCCGPDAFMDDVKLIHVAEGGSLDAFHTERFGAPAVQPPPDVARATGASSHPLTIGDRVVEVGAEETILQAALRGGIVIPCGCGQGLCGTCRMARVSGDIAMSHQGGLSPEEEAAGLILACSSRLRSAASVRFVA